MCHADRALLHDWLTAHGGTVDGAGVIRRKVVAARGEHEAEEAIAALWAEPDPAVRLQQAAAWWEAHPRDARLIFELAGAHDAAGQGARGDPLLRRGARPRPARAAPAPRADPAGVEPARTSATSTRPRRSWTTWPGQRPGSAAVAAFRALVRCDAGEPGGPWPTSSRPCWPTPVTPTTTPTGRSCTASPASCDERPAHGAARHGRRRRPGVAEPAPRARGVRRCRGWPGRTPTRRCTPGCAPCSSRPGRSRSRSWTGRWPATSAVTDGWLEHLYVDPAAQGRGVGLGAVRARAGRAAARRSASGCSSATPPRWPSTRARGCAEVERTDGDGQRGA